MNCTDAYDSLVLHMTETTQLETVAALLAWDQGTQIPVQGHAYRAAQMGALTRVIHKRNTDPKLFAALDACQELLENPEDDQQSANLRVWSKYLNRARKIPERLAVEVARNSTESEGVWAMARQKNDWKSFAPYLEKTVKLKKEVAATLDDSKDPYDVLIEDYEPGESVEELENIFTDLMETTQRILDAILGSSVRPDATIMKREFPQKTQEKMARQMVQALGFDFNMGRMDTTVHPFCTSVGPKDIRITTRYNEHDFAESFFGIVHECGHALYSQGIPAERFGTPCGRAVSLGIHESQSRLWENLVARSKGFWVYAFPQVQKAYPSLSSVDLDAFHFAANEVKPGLIRTDADEVTYNIHIMLRFKLERALLRGELSVQDLPEAWNTAMQKMLGITPETDAQGVMQDVHWASGLLTYFPTYTLGNIYASQFMDAAERELGDLNAMFEKGEFAPLLDWLRTHIHAHGSRYLPRDLVERVTGEKPSAKALCTHLSRKYGELYSLSLENC
ncbi:carboxypeptidase M32 [Desulfobaculum bizertense]|uniref:Metal-dependent carboxypeptidase n=1 Tax=Desulfobaculum bizertense DSM 18034 TaxID=1121442 RepID=A0A1T4VWP2_9BACT|nr:carboxypeptidase M32 [Desulfobaculum bizertense]UIJ36780.1 carboxypeptidase M32 [Desulfobaculum bizertense]SKA69245.1 carboxypeptidase Taq Metallo peptidase. MEROPS family M32 [Desulfobaculum bizertense DSM 18034]